MTSAPPRRRQGQVRQVEAESLPVIHDGALALGRFTQSKVVAEIQQLAQPLDPELDTFLAGIVRTAGEAAAKIAALTAPPATPAGADAEPHDQCAGIDVSHWQGAFDWRGHPDITFAAASAQGRRREDPQFARTGRTWTTFSGKMPRIAYCFGHPGDSAVTQADVLVQLTRDHGLQAGDHLALDLEVTDGISVPEVVSWARVFSRRVNDLTPGHRCFSYTFADFTAPWGRVAAVVADWGVAGRASRRRGSVADVADLRHWHGPGPVQRRQGRDARLDAHACRPPLGAYLPGRASAPPT